MNAITPRRAHSGMPVDSEVLIRAEGVGKCYQIYERPQDRLKQAIVPRLLGLIGRAPTRYFREFWALEDMSFEVRRGEFLGIIGRNGAGKSTLLQLVAGTLSPTCGSLTVRGKVAALLELGSGFNPEFTGRENVWLNASILGLSNLAIERKFAEIEAFAEIGDFIDQPVKTYSSGMLVRLAFAVQTAVEPEVLIVDEALAVGDIFFQAKCMARLRELIDRGVTILLVTHDTATVRQMCDRALLLQSGRLIESGSAANVTDHYLRLELEHRNAARSNVEKPALPKVAPTLRPTHAVHRDGENVSKESGAERARLCDPALGAEGFAVRAAFQRTGSGEARVVNVQLLRRGELRDTFEFGDEVTLIQLVHFHRTLDDVNVSYKIRTPQGVDIVFGDTRLNHEMSRRYLRGCTYAFEWTFRLDLMHGNYCVMSGVTRPPQSPGADWNFIDVVPFCFEFRMAARQEGMVDGLVVWDNALRISALNEDGGRASEESPLHTAMAP